MSALESSNADAVFKFEPFVLHVQCRQLDDAQLMVRTTDLLFARKLTFDWIGI